MGITGSRSSVMRAGIVFFSDDIYRAAGAQLASVEDCFKQADMIVKVKEPQVRGGQIAGGQILFNLPCILAPGSAARPKMCSIPVLSALPMRRVTDAPAIALAQRPCPKSRWRNGNTGRCGFCLEKARRWPCGAVGRRNRRCQRGKVVILRWRWWRG